MRERGMLELYNYVSTCV